MKLVLKYIRESIRLFPGFFAPVFTLAILITIVQAAIPAGIRQFLNILDARAEKLYIILIGLSLYALVLLLSNGLDVVWYRSLDNFGGVYIRKLTLMLEQRLAGTYGENLDTIGRERIHHILYNDVMSAFRVVAHNSASLLSSLTVLIVALAVTAYFHLAIAGILAISFLLGLLFAHQSRKIIKKSSIQINQKMKEHSAVCAEYSDLLDTVQSTTSTLEYYENRTGSAIDTFIQTAKKLDGKQVFLSNVLKHINSLFNLLLVTVLTLNAKNTLADLVFVMTIASIVLDHASRLDQLYYQILSSFGSFQQIENLRLLPQKTGTETLRPIQAVSFDKVQFSYPGAAEPLFEQLSFTLSQGDCVRIHAPNGTGKSTLFKLLQHLYQPQSGNIQLNGMDLQCYRQDSLNQEMICVGQNGQFIQDTVEQYLSLFSGIPSPELQQHAEITICKDIERDKIMQKGGQNLSFGQRKRIQLATLFLRMKTASLVILDEVDSGLDVAGAELYYQKINEAVASGKHIILFVQHGTDTPIRYNKVLDLSRAKEGKPVLQEVSQSASA